MGWDPWTLSHLAACLSTALLPGCHCKRLRSLWKDRESRCVTRAPECTWARLPRAHCIAPVHFRALLCGCRTPQRPCSAHRDFGGQSLFPTSRWLELHVLSWGMLRPGTVLLGAGLSLVSQEKLIGVSGCHCHPFVPRARPSPCRRDSWGPSHQQPRGWDSGVQQPLPGHRQPHCLTVSLSGSQMASQGGTEGKGGAGQSPITDSEGLSAFRPRHTFCLT